MKIEKDWLERLYEKYNHREFVHPDPLEFLYNYENFIANFGFAELINLGEHNQQDDSWELEYLSAEVQVNILFYLAIVFLDRLLFLES